MYADPVGVLPGVSCRRIRGPAAAALAWLAGSATTPSPARADEAGATAASVEPETLAPPAPPRRAYIQYGVAFTVEGVAHAGPVCADPNQPCILGSGGGIDIGVGWRPDRRLLTSAAPTSSRSRTRTSSFDSRSCSRSALELRHYFPTGKNAEPFALAALGLAAYGNEWDVETWGPSATLGGGVEVELSGGAVLDVSLAYRPIYLRSFSDSIPAFHDAGIAHFISSRSPSRPRTRPSTLRPGSRPRRAEFVWGP